MVPVRLTRLHELPADEAALRALETFVPEDINQDGVVDFYDLADFGLDARHVVPQSGWRFLSEQEAQAERQKLHRSTSPNTMSRLPSTAVALTGAPLGSCPSWGLKPVQCARP